MFRLLTIAIFAFSSVSRAEPYSRCGMHFDLLMRSLFTKDPGAKIWTPEYTLGETSRRMGDLDSKIRLSEITGENTTFEKLKHWQMEEVDFSKVKNGNLNVQVWNHQTGESKNVSLFLNEDDLRERLFFSQMKISGKIQLPKNQLVGSSKSWNASYQLDRSYIASVLYHASSEKLSQHPSFVLKGLFHSNQSARLEKILTGEAPLEHIEDLVNSTGPGLSWSSLSARAEKAGLNPKLFQTSSHGGISSVRLNEDHVVNHIDVDEGMNIFLSKIHDMNQDRFPSHYYGMNFSLIREDGSSLNLNYLNAKEMFARSHRDWSPEAVPTQWYRVPEDVRSYVRHRYEQEPELMKKLNLTSERLDQLVQISKEMENRTDYVFITDEQFMKLTPKEKEYWDIASQSWKKVTRTQQREFPHFKIKGTMSIVYAEPHEVLPMEIFAGVKIARPAEGKVAELGRFTVDPSLRPLGSKQIWKTVAMVASRKDVSKICAETSKEYAQQLMDQFGFKKIAEKVNAAGETEFIIEVTPKEFFNASVLNSRK